MPISPLCGLLSLSTRDVAVLIGSASLCGAIASLVGILATVALSRILTRGRR